MLLAAIQFALAVADATDGAFDPTIGGAMESAGFDEDFRTGTRARTGTGRGADFRSVHVDAENRTVTLERPLLLDLGACAKGLAVDVAARELQPFRDFAISAGGDLYASGRNAHGEPWRVGIRHPRDEGQVIETLELTDAAICTSGDYERRENDGATHHLLDARTGRSATALASASVVAPTAMAADALATAAFILGPEEGLALLRRQGVDGVLYSPALERFAVSCFRSTVPTPR
jgi:thiamine biosynthesis lipoprotein